MARSLILLALMATTTFGAKVPESETQLQQDVFQRYWGKDFEWKFSDLPAEGGVAAERVPYSGYIYPDVNGGTVNALMKYDRAFHAGRGLATQHERWDTTAYKKTYQRTEGGGLFRRGRTVSYSATPHWHGHCNGWSAAAMRHAEPKQQVQRNGVVFTPADVKALLAEIYIYNETENLTGYQYPVNAGAFHAIITNWIGRASHPVGMEADPGKEKWNYPIYAYATSSQTISSRQVVVRMNISYAKDSRGESQQSPRIKYTKYFQYALDLNEAGDIVGGYFVRGSSLIDLLWIPLQPKQGGKAGNERGNPHVDVDQVLAVWRDSVPADERRQWLVVDPPKEDRLKDVRKLAAAGNLVPKQNVPVPVVDPAVASAESIVEHGPSEATARAVEYYEDYSVVTNTAAAAAPVRARLRDATVNPPAEPRPFAARPLFRFRRSR